MKRLLIFVLLALMMTTAALAETPCDPFELTAPRGVSREETEGHHTFCRGTNRVVAMALNNVILQGSAEDSLVQLLAAYDANAEAEDVRPDMAEGFCGIWAVTPDKLNAGVDVVTLMVLHGSDLLILSGYSLAGDTAAARALMEDLLANAAVADLPLMPDGFLAR